MAERKSTDAPVTDAPRTAAPRRLAPVGAESLKAFAHPLRMAMYTELQRLGSATASQLGRVLGESSGQTSYHLRQLERHGFVEDDPLHTGGRERWWRPVGFDLTEPSLLRDPATAGPVRAIVQQMIAERAAALSAWFHSLDPDDDGPGLLSSATLALTEAEAQKLTSDLNALLADLADTVRERTPPEDALRFRINLDVFPMPVPEDAGA